MSVYVYMHMSVNGIKVQWRCQGEGDKWEGGRDILMRN